MDRCVVSIGYRPGIDAAIRRRGLVPFTVITSAKPGLDRTTSALVGDLESAHEVVRVVLRAGIEVCGVVTGHEQGVFPAAVLRAALGLAGDRDIARTVRFRDKHLQKAVLGDQVPHARSVALDGSTGYGTLAHELGTPFVVKPATGYGASSTAFIESAAQFEEYVSPHRGTGVPYVAESLVTGPEIHIDGVWRDGALLWSSIGRYLDPPASYHRGGVLADYLHSRSESPGLYAEATSLAERSLRSLDAPNCVFHLEAFLTGPEMIFGELAVRPAGAHVPQIIEATYGTDLLDLQVAISLGEDVDPPAANDPASLHGYAYVRRFAGARLTAEDYRSLVDGVVLAELAAPDRPPGAYGRAGVVLVSAADEQQLRSRLEAVVALNKADTAEEARAPDERSGTTIPGRSRQRRPALRRVLVLPPVKGAATTVLADLPDTEAVLAPDSCLAGDAGADQLLADLVEGHDCTHVVATSESNMALAGRLRERHGLPGADRVQSLAVTDKRAMRLWASSVARMARSWSAAAVLANPQLIDGLPGVVVKPVDGWAARGVERLPGARVADHLANAPGTYLIEEALDVEQEFHCDGYLIDGQVVDNHVSSYDRPVLAARGTTRATLHLPSGHRWVAPLQELAGRLMAAAPIRDGVFHAEFLYAAGELYLGEVAMRPAGGGVATSLRLHRGVPLWDAFIRSQLGLPMPRPERSEQPDRWAGVVGVVARPSAWTEENTAALAALPGVTGIQATSRRQGWTPDESCAFAWQLFYDVPHEADVRELVAAADRVVDSVP